MKRATKTRSKKKSATPPKMLTTIRALAEALGRSDKAIGDNWIRHEAWPFAKRPPWPASQVGAMQLWAEQNLKTGNAEPSDDHALVRKMTPMQRASMGLILERTSKLKQAREITAGKYILKEDVDRANEERERQAVQNIAAVRYELTMVRLVAIRLEGKSAREMETILEEWAKGVCNKFAGDKAIEDASKKETQPPTV